MINIIAHRGASAYAPENTLSAFQKAIDMKADGMECDVHMTKDGEIVVAHDHELGRTSTGKGKIIKDMTLAELKNEDFGKWKGDEFTGTEIPTLDEMCQIVKKMDVINIELKDMNGHNEEGITKIYNIMKKYNIIDKTIISSFDVVYLDCFKKLFPEVKTAFLFASFDGDLLAYSKEHKFDFLHPCFGYITKENVSEAKKVGIGVNVWTVDDVNDMQTCIDYGCTGITTNYPDKGVMIK